MLGRLRVRAGGGSEREVSPGCPHLTWLLVWSLSSLCPSLWLTSLTLGSPGCPGAARRPAGARERWPVLSGAGADPGARLGSCPPVQELTLRRSIPWCWSSMSWWRTTRSRRAPKSACAWARWWISLRRTNQVQRVWLGRGFRICSASQSSDRNSNPGFVSVFLVGI